MKQEHRDRWLQPLNDALCSHAEEERLVGPALLLCALAGAAVAQVTDRPTTTTTPVPILKQVNRVNDDGSYTYGFEAADGSFKLETRDVNGEVTGKYGYVDANGQQQVFEYNANKAAGFSPSSSLIPQPPPGLPQASTSQVAPGTFVGDIDVALDGYSEDLDEDGFVDPIPTGLQRPAARGAAPVRADVSLGGSV
ncbi:larval cuticle protein III/IV-like [Pollicipes pollicipes]|uniref:larval cuticle protein III/IV-like n=1 Tax=Pollicipes pollicipes TaxID=41117 RepID=UPI001884F2AE|nr:larval cuticle protein III/IV-like [Pollicipes pollicipes]